MKRALLVGINYVNSECELNGCVNDVMNVQKMLIELFNYKLENLIMLDDVNVNSLKPTKDNILLYLNKIVDETQSGDTFFMHYSGHGTQVQDIDGDEKNNIDTPGMDSVLCPCDYNNYNGTEGFILDDELKVIINKLPKGSKARMFIDCCHSGTMLDLPFMYRNNNLKQIEALCEGTDDIITISGSRDLETASDAYINGQYSGALTFGLLKTLSNVNKVNTNWLLLLTVVQHYLVSNGYSQVPVLCLGNKKLLKEKVFL